MESSGKIFVTKPYLPPLEDYLGYLRLIWERKVLTNNGPLHQELEQKLCEYLGVDHLSLFANGTIALVTALQALQISGEVITTPFTFAATAHSLLWNNVNPVFVDIDPLNMNLDPEKIEDAITSNTTAIMPVHCYGNPCSVERIQYLAEKYKLKIIYDAAHAFGVRYKGESILRHGDLSVLSFHATKVFNTFEGGAIISPDIETKQRIDSLKNFGFENEITVVEPGINGKMSELNAAMGLLQLEHIDRLIESRKMIDNRYRKGLNNVAGIYCLPIPENTMGNYSYFPVLVGSEYYTDRDSLYNKLKKYSVYARRYFYPLLSNMTMYHGLASANVSNLPFANQIANQVLCLPIYPDLTFAEVDYIIEIIAKCP